MQSKLKLSIFLLAVGICVLAVPATSEAGLLRWMFGEGCCFNRTAYRPVVVANYAPAPCATPCGTPACGTPACAPCTTTQRVCYNVPQTCYRTQYVRVPVTTYRPVTTYDPCTGCPRTCMKACTTSALQARRVPVTTYRQVCSYRQVPVTPVVAASPVVAAPVMSAPVMAAPSTGCSTCTSGVSMASPVVAQPSTQVAPGPLPSTQLAPTPATQGSTQAADQTPTLPVVPSYQGSSYRSTQQPAPAPAPQSATTTTRSDMYVPRVQVPTIKPLPDYDRSNDEPALINPEDRTAQRSVVRAGALMPISWNNSSVQQADVQQASAQQPTTKQWDDSGWTAAN